MDKNKQSVIRNLTVWANDLRETKRPQVMETLRDTDGGSCCLGIACDRWDPEFLTSEKYLETPTKYTVPFVGSGTHQALGDMDPEFGEDDIYYTTASDLNDDLRLSFEQIAYLVDHKAAKKMGLETLPALDYLSLKDF